MTNEEYYIRFLERFNEKHGHGYEYVSGFENSEKPILIKCKRCNHTFTRSAQIARKNKKLTCELCKMKDRKDEMLKRFREKVLKP